jgi:hypothetical protein
MPNLKERALLSQWLQDCVRNPLEESELGGVRNPNDRHQDPLLALELEPDGVPAWWPHQDLETNQRLSRSERRRWFLDWLADELRPRLETLRNGGTSLRRQTIAQSLLLSQTLFRSTGFPTRDSS